ncbi:Hypothetical_protein [Hexamita inflata]|uniref:Hypothetical_protein n=1 Tax=Hexamita inflata TaxID=28002 RepID=A0AA86NW62_9EUKA|nr:Hypothetical protein HINF_LOCUS14965 [Hexamita inflata]
MSVNERKLLSLSQMIFNKIRSTCIVYSDSELVFNVMMLSNSQYSQFWNLLSEFSEFSEHRLISDFMHLSQNVFVLNGHIQHEPSTKFKRSVLKRSAPKQEQFKQFFTENLKQVLSSVFKNYNFNQMTQAELCTFIKENEIEKNKTVWKQLRERIPNKNPKQIRDYYGKTFQKALFTQQLTNYDKANIQALNRIWAEETPAFIAKKFLQISEEDGYFQSNIIIYIANLRNNEKKALSECDLQIQ